MESSAQVICQVHGLRATLLGPLWVSLHRGPHSLGLCVGLRSSPFAICSLVLWEHIILQIPEKRFVGHEPLKEFPYSLPADFPKLTCCLICSLLLSLPPCPVYKYYFCQNRLRFANWLLLPNVQAPLSKDKDITTEQRWACGSWHGHRTVIWSVDLILIPHLCQKCAS